jgi:hypothetical protein
MTPGTYHIPATVRGDTFQGRAIATLTQDDAALAITAARMQVRASGSGTLIHEWTTTGDAPNASIGGADNNVLTIDEVPPETTALWPVGSHAYDLEVVTALGTLTILSGKFPVMGDITRTTTAP